MEAGGIQHCKLSIVLALIVYICGCSESPTHVASYYNMEDDVKITLELYHSHPYLAEYKRQVVFGSEREIFDSRELSDDSGGYAAANLYRCGEDTYLLDGYVNSELIALEGAKDNDGHCHSPENYLGIFKGAGSLPWRFCAASECPEEKLEMQGG